MYVMLMTNRLKDALKKQKAREVPGYNTYSQYFCFVSSLSVLSVSTSVAAMLVESNPSVYVSGAIGAAVAPYAALQQQKLTEVEALKQTNQRLDEEVSQLKYENERLQTQVNELESSVTK